jgi:type II secretory pathway component PulC
MTLYRTVLALSLLAATSIAHAEPAPAPADNPVEPYPSAPTTVPRADVEAVFEGAKQALMFDRNRGEYVVVRVGDAFQSGRIAAITPDGVVLSQSAQHYVLTLPRQAKPVPSAAQPSPPPAPTASAVPLPLEQPLDPYAQTPPVPELAPAPTPTAAPAPAPALTEQQITIARADLDAALADFTTLSQEIQLVREGERIRIKQLAKGTFLHRLGLRPGDLLVSVADKAIYDLDAAAQAYSVLKRTDRFTIKLLRGDNRMKIHVQLKP